MKKITKFLAGIMAAVCMMTSTTALAADISGEMKNLVGDQPEASITKNGVTVEVQKSLMDDYSIFVLYDITIPETMTFTDEVEWESDQLSVGSQEGSNSTYPKIISQKGNKRTVLYRYHQYDAFTDRTVRFNLRNLGYYDYDNMTPYTDEFGQEVYNLPFISMVEGEWNLEWTANKETSISQEPNSQTTINGSIATLKRVTVSPMGIYVLLEGNGNYNDLAPVVQQKDGSSAPYDATSQGGSGHTDFSNPDAPKTYYQSRYYFSSLIKPDDVESVTIGDLTVPMDASGQTSDTLSSWAVQQVNEAVALGIIPSELQQNYTQATTRAEFCALAVNLYETVTATTITERAEFSDTSDVNVQKMAGLGVVDGIGDGKFGPNQNLSRQQAATMLSRLADAIGKPLASGTAEFSDNASIGSWATDAVGAVNASNIMSGVGDNTFAPLSTYTREQSIVTMLRLYNIVK